MRWRKMVFHNPLTGWNRQGSNKPPRAEQGGIPTLFFAAGLNPLSWSVQKSLAKRRPEKKIKDATRGSLRVPDFAVPTTLLQKSASPVASCRPRKANLCTFRSNDSEGLKQPPQLVFNWHIYHLFTGHRSKLCAPPRPRPLQAKMLSK